MQLYWASVAIDSDPKVQLEQEEEHAGGSSCYAAIRARFALPYFHYAFTEHIGLNNYIVNA